MSIIDQHGNPFTRQPRTPSPSTTKPSTRSCATDRAFSSMLPRLIREHPDVPMAQALIAYLSLSSTDLPDVANARDCWSSMGRLPMNDREQAHHKAIGAWVGRRLARCRAPPRRPAAAVARRPARAPARPPARLLPRRRRQPARPSAAVRCPRLDPQHPHTAFVRGMQAFGLEESGDYGAAEAAGLAAVEVNPDDVWAHPRRRAHLRDAGAGRRRASASSWTARPTGAAGNLFTVHNWWHLALYLLEAGATAAGAGHLRRRGAQREVGRRSARDARRQRPAVAAAARRRTTPATGSPRSPTPGRRD